MGAFDPSPAQLRSALALQEAALESVTEGVVVTDGRRRTLLVNRRFLSMWGFGQADGEVDCGIEHASKLVVGSAGFRARIEELYTHVELEDSDRIELLDGRVFELYTAPYRMDDASVGRVWRFRDITEQERATRCLQETAACLAETERLAAVGRWEWTSRSRTLVFSDELLRLHGLDPGAPGPSAEAALEMVHPEDREPVVAEIRAALREKRAFERRLRLIRADGSPREMVLRGRVIEGPDRGVERIVGTYQDITERVEQDQSLRESEARFRGAFDEAPIGMMLLDARSLELIRVNRVLCELTGKQPEELLGRPLQSFIPPGHRATELAAVRRLLAGERERLREERIYDFGPGRQAYLRIDASVIPDPRGEPLYLVAHVEDVTAEHEAHDKLLHAQLHDSLTGLPNRALCVEYLARILGDSDAQDVPVTVLVLGLNRFKLVNESLGLEVGDEVLTTVADRLTRALEPGTMVARLGGDQFAVVRRTPGGEREAASLAQALRDAISKPMAVGEVEIHLRHSTGIALSAPGATPHSLLRDAIAAKHRAEQRGPGEVEFADLSVRPRLSEELYLAGELHRALSRGQMIVVYQPVFASEDHSVVGAECLLRWDHPELGAVTPGRFVPVAEDTGLIVELGEWVLREACRQLARWRADHPDLQLPRVSVNVSGRQLAQPGFAVTVSRILRETGLEPGSLVVELTETVLMEQISNAHVTLQELHDLGVGVFLDDFGTGYSSLAYLSRFPLEGFKIDRAFVRRLTDEPQSHAIVEAMAGMGRALSLTMVAEGVETIEQLERVRQLGCQRIQGFLFGRPMSAERLIDLVLHGAPIPPSPAPAPAPPPCSRRSSPSTDLVGATVTLRDAAAALAISPSTLRRWSDEGRIQAIRTPGGHRRFRAEDIKALADRQQGDRRIRRTAFPTGPAPTAAAVIAEAGLEIFEAAVRSIYEQGSSGWFTAEPALAPTREWLSSLSAAFRTGNYTGELSDWEEYLRQAELAGTSLLERHTMLERFSLALTRALARRGAGRTEAAIVRRAFSVLARRLLESA